MKKVTVSMHLVQYSKLLTEINLKRYCRNSFLQSFIIKRIGAEETPNIVLHKISLFKYLLLLLVMEVSVILY